MYRDILNLYILECRAFHFYPNLICLQQLTDCIYFHKLFINVSRVFIKHFHDCLICGVLVVAVFLSCASNLSSPVWPLIINGSQQVNPFVKSNKRTFPLNIFIPTPCINYCIYKAFI